MRCYPVINGTATREDVSLMLKDTNPVVRLLGARLALNRSIESDALGALSHDDTLVWVGPLYHGGEKFRRMKVSEIMVELRNDPLFELRSEPDCSVHLESVKEVTASDGTAFVFGRLPEYPMEMAGARLDGQVTATIKFSGDSKQAEVKVTKSSQREFEEPTIWALSKWELYSTTGVLDRRDRVFECHLVFRCDE
jgi:hypothetical protein